MIMLDKDSVKEIVRGFLREACSYLGINDSSITIAYMAMPVQMMMVMLFKGSDDIVIDTNMLQRIVHDNTYTVLRNDCYRVVREIYQRRKHLAEGTVPNNTDDTADALAFSYALSFLNGLAIPIPLQFVNEMEKRIPQILNSEFHENCILHASPDPQFKGVMQYRAKKNGEAHKLELNLLKTAKPSIVAINVAEGDKGSATNPFGNVLEACKFIQDEERKAFENDVYMSKTLATRQFNYCPDANIYNIKWADAKAAYCHSEVPENGFIVNQLQSGKFSLKPSLYGRKFLYRGQSKYYERCTPGLFRNSEQDYFLKELIQYDELRVVLASHPLVQLLEKGVDLWHDLFRFEINYGGLAQHYYNKTRYLDLTSDLEAAKFFAITDYDGKKDEYIPHTDTSKFGVMYYYELSEPGAFLPKSQQHLSTIGKQPFMRSGNQHGFLLNMEKDVNFNLLPQVHKVFFRHNTAISQQIFTDSMNGKIYFPSDILQEQWKRFMVQFDTNPVVSLEAVKINVRDNVRQHETPKSIIRKLDSKYGIKVDKNRIPSFDSDLMDQYYTDIKNGWWQDVFCKDIHFVSGDGLVYRDMLLNVPNDSRYKRFFEK